MNGVKTVILLGVLSAILLLGGEAVDLDAHAARKIEVAGALLRPGVARAGPRRWPSS